MLTGLRFRMAARADAQSNVASGSLAIGAAQASQARIVSLWLVFGPGVLVACTRIFKVNE
jgi:hypothetical protein